MSRFAFPYGTLRPRVFHLSQRTLSSGLCVQDEFRFPLSTRSRLDVSLSVDDHLPNTNTVSAARLTSCQTLATRSFLCSVFARLPFAKILKCAAWNYYITYFVYVVFKRLLVGLRLCVSGSASNEIVMVSENNRVLSAMVEIFYLLLFVLKLMCYLLKI